MLPAAGVRSRGSGFPADRCRITRRFPRPTPRRSASRPGRSACPSSTGTASGWATYSISRPVRKPSAKDGLAGRAARRGGVRGRPRGASRIGSVSMDLPRWGTYYLPRRSHNSTAAHGRRTCPAPARRHPRRRCRRLQPAHGARRGRHAGGAQVLAGRHSAAAARYAGRVVKLMGDGVLVEFASAVNAVQCAVRLQEAMAAANGDVPPDSRIRLRVGINLGDVMPSEGHRHADEGLADRVPRVHGVARRGAAIAGTVPGAVVCPRRPGG
jgi:hypothetical protein